jgi:hypothetical protein
MTDDKTREAIIACPLLNGLAECFERWQAMMLLGCVATECHTRLNVVYDVVLAHGSERTRQLLTRKDS